MTAPTSIMNTSPVGLGLTPQIWDSTFFTEYVRTNRFKKYMGTDVNSIIQLNEDLTRKKGDSITWAAVRKLVAAGVTGNTILEGNEEILDSEAMKLTANVIRHAVAVTEWDEQRSAIDLRNAARAALKVWMMEKMRNDIISALHMVGGGVPFIQATTAQQNAWLTANSDRILFGGQKSYTVGGSVSGSLQNITATQGKLTTGAISLAKRMAKMTHPAIRPVTVKDDQEWFVLFAHSLSFRDLKNDPVMIASLQNAMPRSKDNPLFTDDDLVWDGVIIREIPEFATLTGLGGGGIDIAANVMCGAQAIGVGWAQRTKTTTNVRDYGFQSGVGIQEIRAIGKLVFPRSISDETDLVDQGTFTMFTSAVADS